MSDPNSSLKQAWLNLPPTANEPTIARKLVIPEILNRLEYSDQNNEITEQYQTGKGSQAVDIAARKNLDGSIFSHDLTNASIIVELKRRELDLSTESND
ncbi:MAG: hypothetical protein ACK58N_03305 [Synechocystis sp.]